jgi:hypothetical protein
VSTRICPYPLPENQTYPAVTYQQISEPVTNSLGVKSARIQINCYAETYSSLIAISEAIENAMESVTEETEIIMAYLDNRIENYDQEVNIYYIIMDYIIRFTKEY